MRTQTRIRTLLTTALIAITCKTYANVETTWGTITDAELKQWNKLIWIGDPTDAQKTETARNLVLNQILATYAALKLVPADEQLHQALIRTAEDSAYKILAEKALKKKTQISEEEINQWIKTHKMRATSPELKKLRIIYKRCNNPQKCQEAHRLLERLKAEADSGADFAKLAVQYSDSETRYMGGELPPLDPNRLKPPLSEAVAALKPGQTSDILTLEEGLALLRCDGIVPARNWSQEKLRETARKAALSEKTHKIWAEMEKQAEEAASSFAEKGSSTDPCLASLSPADAEAAKILFARGDRSKEQNAVTYRAKLKHLACQAKALGLQIDQQELHQLSRMELTRLLAKTALAQILHQVDSIPVTDKDVSKLVSQRPELFTTEEKFLVTVVELNAGKALKSKKTAMDLMWKIRDKWVAGENIEAACKELGCKVLGPRELTRRELFRTSHSFPRAVDALKEGEISTPVTSGEKILIMMLHKKIPRRKLNREDALAEARRIYPKIRRYEAKKAMREAIFSIAGLPKPNTSSENNQH